MIPVTVSIFLCLGLVVVIILQVSSQRRAAKAVTTNPQKAIAEFNKKHQLVKTWDNRHWETSRDQLGWWFHCSCGLKAPGSNVGPRSYGTESGAIHQYKSHAKLHLDLNQSQPNPFEEKYKELLKDFQEYQEKCFCKDTNDDLILLKHKHLDKPKD